MQSTILQSINKNVSSGWEHLDIPWEDSLNVISNYNFESILDGPTVIKYISGLDISSGVTVTVSNRCKGLVLFINGNTNIAGTLTMTARGAYAAGDELAIDYKQAELLVTPSPLPNYDYTISKTGGSGGVGRSRTAVNYTITGAPGNSSVSSSGGGGGGALIMSSGGSHSRTCYSGSGAAGTSYSGGSGGGAGDYNTDPSTIISAGSGAANGGPGGYANGYRCSGCSIRCSGGGAGNNGGAAYSNGCTGYAGSAGTGGLLVLVINGDLNITSTGIISSNGSNGGHGRAGGGGSGGGSIRVLYTGNYTNNGTIQANGGLSSGTAGGSGGAGSIVISKIVI